MKFVNELKHSRKMHIILIQLLFILLAIAFTAYSTYSDRLTSTSDMVLNYQRIIETFKQILHLQIPQFSLYTSLPVGNDLETFYPWLILVPFTPLILIIHSPVFLWNTIISIFMFIGLEISFFTCNKKINNVFGAMIFAIAYCISTIEISYVIAYADIGAFISMLFMPLVFFGWIYWIRSSKWRMMTIGLVLMLYSHLATTLIVVGSLVILTLLFWFDKDNLHRWNKVSQLLKAIITFTITTCFVWLPILVIMDSNRIIPPLTNIVGINKAYPVIPNSLTYFVAPFQFRVWTFSDLACLVICVIYWKEISWTLRKFVLMGLGYILLNASCIKMWLMTNTPLKYIQFMFRISLISHLLLSYVFALIVVKILCKKWYIQNVLSLLITLFVITVASIFLSDIDINVVHRWPSHDFNNIYREMHTKALYKDSRLNQWMTFIITNNRTMRMPIYTHINSHGDYLRINQAVQPGISNKGLTNYGFNVNMRSQDNGVIKFRLPKKDKRIVLPISIYNKQKYHIYLNNHLTRWRFNHKYDSAELFDVPKGINKVQVKIPIMNYRYISLFATFIGWIILLVPISNIYDLVRNID